MWDDKIEKKLLEVVLISSSNTPKEILTHCVICICICIKGIRLKSGYVSDMNTF